jgi:hypothetical protein
VLARRLGWKRRRAVDRIARIVAGVGEHMDGVLSVSGLPDETQERYRAIVYTNIEGL